MIHVLIIEDEPAIARGLSLLITKNYPDFQVLGICKNGRDGLQKILEQKPELVFTDITMPVMNGLDMIEEVQKSQFHTRFVILTGYADFEYARKALRFGCAGYLVKPVEEKELTEYLVKIKQRLDENKAAGEGKAGGDKQEEGYQSEKLQVQAMVKYIQEHYAQALTLQVLSGEFKMSESYISSLIKKRTGKGFSEHLMEIRIRKAQEYLRTTNDSIETIAERVGYPDYFYFTKVYKKATGISPAAYRRQL